MSVRLTERDAQVLEWFSIVRVTTMDGIRWVLGALNESSGPVSRNQAFVWVRRMQELGMVERSRVPPFRGTMLWATPKAIKKRAPDLLRQTTRHELMVSVISARYLHANWSWNRDLTRAATLHEADGVAYKSGVTDLVEVEMTGKRRTRYFEIFEDFFDRMKDDPTMRVVYLCTSDAGRVVRDALTKGVGVDIAPRTLVVDLFGRDGAWIGEEYPPGLFDATQPYVSGNAPVDGIGAWMR